MLTHGNVEVNFILRQLSVLKYLFKMLKNNNKKKTASIY